MMKTLAMLWEMKTPVMETTFAHGANLLLWLHLATQLKMQEDFHQLFLIAAILMHRMRDKTHLLSKDSLNL